MAIEHAHHTADHTGHHTGGVGPRPGPGDASGPDASPGPERRQRVRTFKPRRRSLSPARQQRLDDLAPRWLVEGPDPTRGWTEVFGRDGAVVFDIGVGDGRSCVDLAHRCPDLDVVGVDVHTPGIAHAVFCAADDELSNLRLYHGDVFDLLDRVGFGSLAGIRVLFPDPWPKVRHRNRRMITPARIEMLTSRLAVGGWIHLATDIDDYAHQMDEVCRRHPELVGGFVERSDRSVTRFEQRGLDAGRSIAELVFERQPDPGDSYRSSASSVSWANRFSRSTASMNSDTIS